MGLRLFDGLRPQGLRGVRRDALAGITLASVDIPPGARLHAHRTISRLEKRSDMLLSTLRHYVESMGGKLDLVAQLPNRPPVVIKHLGAEQTPRRKAAVRRSARSVA
jgi:hypothetical protein